MSAKRLTRTELIRALHHALNTPLVSISNLTEMLLLGVEGTLSPTVRQDVTDIADDAQRLQNVVAQILELVARDVTAFHFQHIDLVEVLLHASQTDPHCVMVEVPHEPLSIWGDQKALVQVMQKLAVQVRRAQTEGDIALHIRIADIQVHLSVSGERLPGEQRSTHLDDASSIELLFCCQVIEAHGGTLWIAEGMNQPAQFIISLPLMNTGSEFKADLRA